MDLALGKPAGGFNRGVTRRRGSGFGEREAAEQPGADQEAGARQAGEQDADPEQALLALLDVRYEAGDGHHRAAGRDRERRADLEAQRAGRRVDALLALARAPLVEVDHVGEERLAEDASAAHRGACHHEQASSSARSPAPTKQRCPRTQPPASSIAAIHVSRAPTLREMRTQIGIADHARDHVCGGQQSDHVGPAQQILRDVGRHRADGADAGRLDESRRRASAAQRSSRARRGRPTRSRARRSCRRGRPRGSRTAARRARPRRRAPRAARAPGAASRGSSAFIATWMPPNASRMPTVKLIWRSAKSRVRSCESVDSSAPRARCGSV